MKNTAYRKSIGRELKSSKARFLSILFIIFLGVAFYVGIKGAGPSMQDSMEEFYIEKALMDSKIVSTLGLTEKDIDLLKDNDKIAAYSASHTIDANVTNHNSVVRFMDYDKEKSVVNQYEIIEGRLPENSGEIAFDEEITKYNPDLKIGDTYTIESEESIIEHFETTSFTIVGFVKSPMYIDRLSKGTTTVGKGKIDYYAVINQEDMAMDVYTELYVCFQNLVGVDAYSDEYKERMDANNAYLEALYSERRIDRIEEVKAEAYVDINEGYSEVEDGEKKLAEAKQEMADGKLELENGKKEYEQALLDYDKSIKDAETQIAESEQQLEAGQQEIKKQKQLLSEGKEKLEQAKKELEKAKEQFENQGVDPEQNVKELKKTVTTLTALAKGYDTLSEEMKHTTNNLGEGEAFVPETIQTWKATAHGLGLTEFDAAFAALEANPTDTNTALVIAAGLDAASGEVTSKISHLNTLIEGVDTYQAGKAEYETQVKTLEAGERQLKEAQKEIDAGKTALTKAKQELENGKVEGKEALEKAKEELSNGEKELADGEVEIKKNEKKLMDARAELEEAEEQLKELEDSKYYFFTREENPGYAEFKDVVERLASISSVFPLVFFVVAVLICLTTMTRMVEENRTEIGTLKALGYTNIEIAKKYIIYAAAASIVGGIIGIFVGFNLFPKVIILAYSTQYVMPTIGTRYYATYILEALLISNLCTIGAVLVVLKVDLASNPSILMRPKAPKVGKKIFLERIKPVWKRLNFNQKVTCRNLFRYKQRMIMTVFGIAACAAMIITGFGLQDSINDMMEKQFDKLWNYDAIVIFGESPTKESSQQYETLLSSMNAYEGSLNMYQEMVSFSKETMNKQSVALYVPENTDKLAQYILLNDRVSGEVYELNNDGAIINEKLARLLDVSEGDEITFTADEKQTYTVKVAHIIESYLSHGLYLSPEYYETIFGKTPAYNSQYLKLDLSEGGSDEIASTLMSADKVINVTMMGDLTSTSTEVMGNLNVVVIILIVAAGGLAFVVLYNLNNINVSERIRELSTIKVLGFYDAEVSMYIFRENTILTMLGILFGMGFGKILHGFVLVTAEADSMMFSPNVYPRSYIYAALLTILFSVIVMVFMHRKLKKINMIDALKSTE